LRCRRTTTIFGIRVQRHAALIQGVRGRARCGSAPVAIAGARASAEGRRKTTGAPADSWDPPGGERRAAGLVVRGLVG
jgi:hypothetical protein